MSNKGYVRLTFLLWSKPNKDNLLYNGIEILENDFFELDFSTINPKYCSLSETANENILNNMEVIYDDLVANGFGEPGLYEIYGLYTQEWTSNYDYWSGATDYDCEWQIDDLKIKKFKKLEVKRFLEDMYWSEHNRYDVMGMIKCFGLESEIITVRDDREHGIHSVSLFNYSDSEDNIDISILQEKD